MTDWASQQPQDVIVYRASELGGCDKALVAKRLGYRPVAIPANMQKVFDRGHAHEIACVENMRAMGWTVREQQKAVRLDVTPEVCVYGHLDGLAREYGSPIPWRVLEVKAPGAFRTFLDEMYDDDPSPLTERYKWQVSVGMVAEGKELVLACLDEDYQLRFHGIEMPFYDEAAIKARVEALEGQVAAGLPQACNRRSYPCPFVYLHEDETTALQTDAELDELATRRVASMEAVKAAKVADDYNKELLLAAMGSRRKVVTAAATISVYNRTNTRYDYDKMRADGIDVDSYKVESVSSDIPKVTMRGGRDGDS